MGLLNEGCHVLYDVQNEFVNKIEIHCGLEPTSTLGKYCTRIKEM
jgi:hypothetical protein